MLHQTPVRCILEREGLQVTSSDWINPRNGRRRGTPWKYLIAAGTSDLRQVPLGNSEHVLDQLLFYVTQLGAIGLGGDIGDEVVESLVEQVIHRGDDRVACAEPQHHREDRVASKQQHGVPQRQPDLERSPCDHGSGSRRLKPTPRTV